MRPKTPSSMEVTQLFGITDDIDCLDPGLVDVERGGLEFTVRFESHEAGQSVDEAESDELRAAVAVNALKANVIFEDMFQAADRAGCGAAVSAAIRVNADVLREHRSKL